MNPTVIHLDKFKPRPYQIPMMDALLNKGYDRVLAILPRRAGKDLTAFNIVIRMLIRKVQTIYYVFPTFNDGRNILWDALTNDGFRVLDYLPEELVESRNEQMMRIKLKNGSVFQVMGSNKPDKLVGTNPSGIVFSEYAKCDERVYQFAGPILNGNGGWALFISTPRGKNHFWDLYNISQHYPEKWFGYKMDVEQTGHIPVELILGDVERGEISEDMAQQEYWCFPSTQEVLTSDSSKKIDKVLLGDLVYSHSGRLRKVTALMNKDYSGELIRIKSYGSSEDIVCTPDHPIQVYSQLSQTYSWKKAQDIHKLDRLVFPKISLGTTKIISYELAMILAWYITEGSCFKNGVQFSIGNQEESDRITYLLGLIGLKSVSRKHRTCICITVNSVQLVDFFKSTCGTIAETKKIPLELISGFEVDFFHELIKGDGCHFKSAREEKFVYTTISKTLAYQVQLLAHSLNKGYAAGISVRKSHEAIIEHRTVHCMESYQVNISFEGLRQNSGWLIRAKNCIAARVINVSKESFMGKVYNLAVQYDESYLVGGRAVHNCSFEMGVEGAYYAKYIDRMHLNEQIGRVPWDPGLKVHTSWDIGYNDATAIIFFQASTTGTIHIIDYHEKSKEEAAFHAKVVLDKPYQYGTHIGPHDVWAHNSTGDFRWKKYNDLGINMTRDHNQGEHPESIDSGIEAVKTVLSKCYIDELKCKQLLKALENYRQEKNVKKETFGKPVHDKHSHAADAMRYLAVGLKRAIPGRTAEDLNRMHMEARGIPTQGNLPPIFNSANSINRNQFPSYR